VLPTLLLQYCIKSACNASLPSGDLPETQKSALIFPRLKKPTLDAEDANSYRPISNSSVTSKFVERVVATRFTAHAERLRLFPSNQSAYRRHDNMETDVVSVRNDIIRVMDCGEVTALVLLDLSLHSIPYAARCSSSSICGGRYTIAMV